MKQRIEEVLARYLPQENKEPINLHKAMRYAVLNGGKRLRPLLVYAVGESYGTRIENLDAAAAAIELVHVFSLIHDDLPAMDNDDLRRGKPTCHKAFGEATAILAGDALLILAFQILAEQNLPPKIITAMIQTLAIASGSRGMTGGQDVDMQATGNKPSIKQLENMYILKTGALFVASVKLGALAAGINDENEFKKLEELARNYGLAFQIQNDILDIENKGKDVENNKVTYPQIVGIEAAKKKILELQQTGNDKLRSLFQFLFKIGPST